MLNQIISRRAFHGLEMLHLLTAVLRQTHSETSLTPHIVHGSEQRKSQMDVQLSALHFPDETKTTSCSIHRAKLA